VVDEFGPLPIFGHTVDGNQNGHTAVAEQLALIRQHLRPPELTIISDRGTFSAGHLGRLSAAGYHALLAVPWEEVQPLFDSHQPRLKWKTASYLSLEQQRRRTQGSLPQEHYELAVVKHDWDEERVGPDDRLPRDLRVQHGRSEGGAEEPREVGRETPRGAGADPAQRGRGPPPQRCDGHRPAGEQALGPAASGRLLPL
jgi:hypothetical protein